MSEPRIERCEHCGTQLTRMLISGVWIHSFLDRRKGVYARYCDVTGDGPKAPTPTTYVIQLLW